MKSKNLVFIIGFLFCFSLMGCSGGGDTDDSGGTNVVGTGSNNSRTVETTVAIPVSTGGASVRGNLLSIYGQATTATTTVVTGAKVTITLSNGEVIEMTDNGNGKYSAKISNLENGGGFVIEARKGDLIVQNLITDLENTDLTKIETNNLTTLFTQVAMAFAQNEGLKVAKPGDLIRNVTNVKFEFNQLKKEVAENVEYEKARKIVEYALVNSDTTKSNAAEGGSFFEKIVKGEVAVTINSESVKWTEQVSAPISSGTLFLPVTVASADEAIISSATWLILEARSNAEKGIAASGEKLASISAFLSDDMIHFGTNKQVFLNQITTPSTSASTDKFTYDHFTGSVVLKKVDASKYVVGIKGTLYLKNSAGETQEVPKDTFNRLRGLAPEEKMFPLIVKKATDGTWKMVGNGKKIDKIFFQLQFNRNYALAEDDPFRKCTYFDVEVDETTLFPIQSVVVSGGNMKFENSLAKDATLNDSNAWTNWTTNNGTTHIDSIPGTRSGGGKGWQWGGVTHKDGDLYKFLVTFTDGTTQEYHRNTLGVPSPYEPLNGTVKVENGQVVVTWDKNTSTDFANYTVIIHSPTEGNTIIFSQGIRDQNTVTTSIPLKGSRSGVAYQMKSGTTYHVFVGSPLKTGFVQSFGIPFTIP